MPVVAVATECHVYPKVLSNIQEVRARGARVIAIASEGDEEISRHADHVLFVPRVPELFAPVVVTPPLQLLAYHVAKLRGLRRRPASEPRQERHGRVVEPSGIDRGIELEPLGGYPSGVEILGLGVDICEIERMERALGRHPAMRERVFTPEERAYCDAKARPAESYAGRFAAREAVIKALGGYRGKRWQDISVTRAPSGAPSVRLEGNAKARADQLGISDVLITFTHERTSAVAFAVAVSG